MIFAIKIGVRFPPLGEGLLPGIYGEEHVHPVIRVDAIFRHFVEKVRSAIMIGVI